MILRGGRRESLGPMMPRDPSITLKGFLQAKGDAEQTQGSISFMAWTLAGKRSFFLENSYNGLTLTLAGNLNLCFLNGSGILKLRS